MPSYRKEIVYPCSNKQLYAMVADVASYPEFLPWCTHIKITSQTPHQILADTKFGIASIQGTLRSCVSLQPQKVIKIISTARQEGPITNLDSQWTFDPQGTQSCRVNFVIDVSLSNPLYNWLLNANIDKVGRRMMKAFSERAQKLYSMPRIEES